MNKYRKAKQDGFFGFWDKNHKRIMFLVDEYEEANDEFGLVDSGMFIPLSVQLETARRENNMVEMVRILRDVYNWVFLDSFKMYQWPDGYTELVLILFWFK